LPSAIDVSGWDFAAFVVIYTNAQYIFIYVPVGVSGCEHLRLHRFIVRLFKIPADTLPTE